MFDLCCFPYNEVDKTDESKIPKTFLRIFFKAIHKQLDLFGLLPYMNDHKIMFTSDRGTNILKAFKCEYSERI